MRRWLPLALAVVATAGAAVTKIGRMTDPAIRESSGLGRSHRDPDLYWTHGDSGNPPTLFAIRTDGSLVGAVSLRGARNRDWEAMTIEPNGTLWVGDIGDNACRRDEVVLYRLPEPDPRAGGEVPAVALRCRYPDGAHDAESLFAKGGKVFIITKQPFGTAEPAVVYVGMGLREDRVNDLRAVTALRLGQPATDAAISPDGRRIAITGYLHVFVFEAEGDVRAVLAARPRRVPLGGAGQCEAVTFCGDDLLLTNEGGDIMQVRQAEIQAAPRVDVSVPER